MTERLNFHGPNAGYVLELYSKYQQNPAFVDPATRALFESGAVDVGAMAVGAAEPAQTAAAPTEVSKIVAVARVARLIRELGHLAANLDPLGGEPPGDPGLELATHGLQTEDLAVLPASVVGGPLAASAPNALEAVGKLRRVYSGSVGYEDDHVQISEERAWLREAVETGRFFQDFGRTEKRDLLERLTEVETFEQFLHKTPPYQGQKRFSIEGSDMLVPLLDAIIRCTSIAGSREVVIGMAHRGRLNVLAHVLNKPYEAILAEFAHSQAQASKASVSGAGSLGYSGDVKYHLGHRRAYTQNGVKEMPITLAPNPSHLEFVNPAVVGRARAAQETRNQPGPPVQDPKASLAILIHGDAAFPGQGVVAETLNLSQIPGYRIGGTIHIIVNNQIGFTTAPKDSRSTLYASDLAKGFEIPIVHVNADDPVACIAVARMACAYHERFAKDFLIDLIGYRRLGHNEGDEPAFTQPRMYETIRAHPTVRALWAKELEHQEIVSRDEAEAMVQRVRERLLEAKNRAVPPTPDPNAAKEPVVLVADRNGEHAPSGATGAMTPATGVGAERLSILNDALLARPEGFTVDAKLETNFLQGRRTALQKSGGIFWAHAEALAFASILEDGTPIRLTGQDTERGTFTQRHLVLHDPTTGARFCPLQALPQARASFALHNSPLSEQAALGFEYGYSVHAAGALVLWEAQFGDFANSAQVIVDQFIASGQSKWGQAPSLVLLLPHGYEGQGPEHSSARLERFLQLCANDSMRVANCTTPAQYFHLLRRQAAQVSVDPRPLVVMTPKSLLRHPRAVSSLADLTEGKFLPVLEDERAPELRSQTTRLVLCSGKVYVDLLFDEKFQPRVAYTQAADVAVARIEELNPFPAEALENVLAGYPHLREVVWLQEEPRNMGAWSFVQGRIAALLGPNIALRYVGRLDAASPAEGSAGRHAQEQSRIALAAFDGAPKLQAGRGAAKERTHVSHAR